MKKDSGSGKAGKASAAPNPEALDPAALDPGAVEAIVAEITNTPWGQRHAYVLPGPGDGSDAHQEFDKRFHVSPFMPMQQRYSWRFSQPGQRLLVHMENLESGRRVFDATLALQRRDAVSNGLAVGLIVGPERAGASAIEGALGAVLTDVMQRVGGDDGIAGGQRHLEKVARDDPRAGGEAAEPGSRDRAH